MRSGSLTFSEGHDTGPKVAQGCTKGKGGVTDVKRAVLSLKMTITTALSLVDSCGEKNFRTLS